MDVRYRSAAGRGRISVTQVLSLAGRIDATWFTPEAAHRGQCVHALTERFDRGEDLGEVPEAYMGYLEAYAEFVAVVRPQWADLELEVHSELWDVAGRIDRVATKLFGAPGILDIKTGGPAPWHAVQVAAYNAIRPTGARWCLYLQPNGRYSVRHYDDDGAYRKFFQDLTHARALVLEEQGQWRRR